MNGKRHREDGPAVIWANGTKSWYMNGKQHREDGPAIERADGSKSWWLNDVQVDPLVHMLMIAELQSVDSYYEIK